MKMSPKCRLICLLMVIQIASFGQSRQYPYKRPLSGITDTWHKIVLPVEMYGKVSPDFSDVRIPGITANHDTIEAPYLVRSTFASTSREDLPFKIINRVRNQNGCYYTFELQSDKPVSQIALDFNRQNFDWRITLEGSQNQQEWYTITENYRIVAIQNELTDYHFTQVNFPETRYRYYRLLVQGEQTLDLKGATVAALKTTPGVYRNYPIQSFKTSVNKKEKQTIVELILPEAVPVTFLKLAISSKFDYYRPVSIQYVADSVQTQNGWTYRYNSIAYGTLSSLEKPEFELTQTFTRLLRIVISNYDNEPLAIDSVEVKGVIHELVCRFTQKADYYLAYGNSKIPQANYDIVQFADKIPPVLTPLTIGPERSITSAPVVKSGPLFQNKWWLWAIMAILIVLLGGFSISMMRDMDRRG
jgi:hypothetical protein